MVGNGTPEEARSFVADRQLAFPVLVDPRLRAYRAAGMRRSVLAVASLRTVTNALRAAKAGFERGHVQGDPWQLGGAFVILRGGHVAFEQRSDVPGDHADGSAIVAALDPAT